VNFTLIYVDFAARVRREKPRTTPARGVD